MAAELLRDNGETDRCIAWTTAAVFAPRPTLATARCNGDTDRSLGGEVDDSCDAEALGPHDITERKRRDDLRYSWMISLGQSTPGNVLARSGFLASGKEVKLSETCCAKILTYAAKTLGQVTHLTSTSYCVKHLTWSPSHCLKFRLCNVETPDVPLPFPFFCDLSYFCSLSPVWLNLIDSQHFADSTSCFVSSRSCVSQLKQLRGAMQFWSVAVEWATCMPPVWHKCSVPLRSELLYLSLWLETPRRSHCFEEPMLHKRWEQGQVRPDSNLKVSIFKTPQAVCCCLWERRLHHTFGMGSLTPHMSWVPLNTDNAEKAPEKETAEALLLRTCLSRAIH